MGTARLSLQRLAARRVARPTAQGHGPGPARPIARGGSGDPPRQACRGARVLMALVLAAVAPALTARAAEGPAPAPAAQELAVEDFDFAGPLGSEGARVEKVGRNHFRVTLGHAPNQPTWSNKLQFRLLRHARGIALRVDAVFACEKPQYVFDEYFYSWSADGREWHPVQWGEEGRQRGRRGTLQFPPFPADAVTVGHQVPLSYEDLVGLVEAWAKHPAVRVHVVGRSTGGRNLYRVTVADPAGPPEESRWVHYFANQHPGEHNAQWRMVGMLEWLLSDEGADARRRSVCHFLPMMSPDAPSKGWYRTNSAGVDMNRSYRPEGADPAAQTHEPYVFQKDLEGLMASRAPVTAVWAMHTWGGIVEPIARPGPEMGTALGPWTLLRDTLERHDTADLIKPLKVREKESYGGTSWTDGPHRQFGVTAVLCEGAGAFFTKQQNLDSGVVLIQALAEYYKGTRPAR